MTRQKEYYKYDTFEVVVVVRFTYDHKSKYDRVVYSNEGEKKHGNALDEEWDCADGLFTDYEVGVYKIILDEYILPSKDGEAYEIDGLFYKVISSEKLYA
jgi:hypothetical protein